MRRNKRRNKLIISLFLLLFFILIISLSAQQGWIIQNPLPTNQYLMDIQMINSQTGYVAGYYGTLLKTTNAGKNWINMNVPTTKHLESLFFYNEYTGWIGGGEGLLAKTTNGGINWAFKSFDTTKTLISIYYKNENEGYMGARYGGLFRTTNAGLNWVNLDTLNKYLINKYYFSSGLIGYASGSYDYNSTFYGLFLKTNNGGYNWNMIPPSGSLSEFLSMKFFNSNTGYIGGDMLLRTTNSAANWDYINKPSGEIYSFYFKDFYTGYILNYYQSEKPKLYKTTNAGASWENLNISDKYYFYEVEGVGDTLYLSGYLGDLARSYNGGANWSYNDIIKPYLYSMYFFNSLTGWACGSDGSLVYTDDGGELWQKKPFPDTTTLLKTMHFVNNNTGFIGGNYGKLFRTTNAGNNWEMYSTNITSTFFYLSFINSLTGFASTYQGEIFKTTNSGVNWYLIKNFNGTSFYDIHFFNENKGLISKSFEGTQILITTDGGTEWNSVFSPDCLLYDFYFINDNTGYASGTSRIYKTTNGGYNWFQVNSYTGGFMYSVYAKQNYVWACGGSGKILFSSNGGSNWQYQDSKTNQTLNCIFFLDLNTGYVCGGPGYIAKTTNSGIVFISKISSTIPELYLLEQNYPNPFNSSTIIKFHIPKNENITIKLYDILGRYVLTLINEIKSPGIYQIELNASSLPSGIYFYKLTSDSFTSSKRLVLLK